jgi:CBS domain containing-hemolysin-like protein
LNEGSLYALGALAAVIAVHAAWEFGFAALNNCRRSPLQDRAAKGESSARRAIALNDDLLRLRLAGEFMRLVLRFAAAAVAVLGFVVPLIGVDNTLDPAAELVLVLVPTAAASFLLGSILPAALGSAYADRAAPIVAGPMRLTLLLLSPMVALLAALNRSVTSAVGSEEPGKAVTEEEIMTLVNVGQQDGTIEDDEKAMIYSVLQFNETIAREVMIPRPDIVAIDIETPLEVALREFIGSGHSRIPVYEDSIDHVRGVLYAKDLLTLLSAAVIVEGAPVTRKPIRDLMRPAYFVPETKRADALFKELQDNKIHIAIIVDEYGVTAGLLTIEDLLEEIVGDIRDEFDVNEEAEFVESSDGEYIVDGSMNLDDLEELLQTTLPADDNDSIGGFIVSRLGRVPQEDEVLNLEESRLVLRVQQVEDRRIRKVHVMRLPDPVGDEETRPQLPAKAKDDSRELPALKAKAASERTTSEIPSSVRAAH